MQYISPTTAIDYLEKTGLSRRGICDYAGIGVGTLYRIIRARKSGTPFVRSDVQHRLQAAFERRRAEMEADAKVREEEGL